MKRAPGGSSGGAAAAVAARLTPLEVGSDLAGSIRLPAHFCGVYGLKTTEHRVPFTGFFRQPPGVPRSVRIMSCLGPMARDLGDLELALGIIAGPDGRDGDVPPVPLDSPPRRRLKDLRLTVAPTLPGARIAGSVRRQVERVAAATSNAGAKVDQRLPDIAWDDLTRLFGDLAPALTNLFTPGADLRDEQRTLSWYFDRLEKRDRFVASCHKFFETVDALILPSCSTTAFTHRETGSPIPIDGEAVNYWEVGRLAVFCNLTGLPALAVPAGLDDDGLPIGIEIVGPRWSEMRLLDIARQVEEAEILPGFRPPPS
jgi:amidase